MNGLIAYKIQKLKCPYYPDNDDNMDTGYIVESIGEKRVAEYLRISMLEVEELDFVKYLFFLEKHLYIIVRKLMKVENI